MNRLRKLLLLSLTLTILFPFLSSLLYNRLEDPTQFPSFPKNFSFINASNQLHSYAGILDLDPNDLDIPPLRNLCKSVKFRDGVFLKANSIPMGAFNAKNAVQNLLRLSILGGLNLVLPQFILRNKNSLSLDWDGRPRRDLDMLFDVDFLQTVMKFNCPQMQIKRAGDVNTRIFHYLNLTRSERIHPNKFVQKVEETLAQFNQSVSLRALIEKFHTFLNSETEEEHLIWGKILRYKPLVVSLARSIVGSFKSKNFGGIHFRVEKDFATQPNNQVTQEEYMRWSIEFIERIHKPGDVIYVGVGDQTMASMIAREIQKRGFVYESKFKWMNRYPKMAKHLNTMEWDEIGLIDYLVLLGSTTFVGNIRSSFSYTLANHREVFSTGKLRHKTAPNTFLIGNYDEFNDYLWY